MKPKILRFPILIYLVALALRLIPVLLAGNLPIGLDDMFQYDMLARSLAGGNGFRWYAAPDLARIREFLPLELPANYDPNGVETSFRGPAYPVFLASIYVLVGVGARRFFFARLAQALLTASIAPLGWSLAREAGFGERTARWAAAILAGFPLLIIYPLALATENLFLILTTAALILILRATNRMRRRDALLAGLTMGLAALTRSIITAFVPLVILFWLLGAREKRRAATNSLFFLLGFFVLTMPWAVRNSLLHHKPTWLESSLGYNLYLGYHPQSQGTFQFGISVDLLPIIDDARRDETGTRAALEFIRSDPARVPYLMLRKLGYFWGLDRRALMYFYSGGYFGHWPPALLAAVMALDAGPLVLLAPLAVVGLFCGPWNRQKTLLALFPAYYTFIHMLILSEPRFHLPLFPILAVLAACACIERPWRASRRWQRLIALALIFLLFLNWGFELARDWPVLVQLFGPNGHNLRLSY